MDYIIKEVMVGQIVVQFADGSRAVVGVTTTNTAVEIDHLVSFFDPDYLPAPETAINDKVAVGERRTSFRQEETEESSSVSEDDVPDVIVEGETPSPAPVAPYALGATYLAMKMAEAGDTSAIEAIERNLAARYPDGEGGINGNWIVDFMDNDTNTILAALAQEEADAAEAEEIFAQAMEELENE